jgi:hypothetical protein
MDDGGRARSQTDTGQQRTPHKQAQNHLYAKPYAS